MPRPNPPPTPGSSSDLRGKESTLQAPVFNLPPNALQDADRASTISNKPSINGSDSSYRPVSPASPADLSRKRPAAHSEAVVTKDDFALPLPPTRSRKIIQMKPRESGQEERSPQTPTANTHAIERRQSTSQTSARKGRNNSNGNTAAGRKIARKTAHSLIERRRRSKMNEEFGVLKDMIPACKGQEMHKLAILQASIDYLRYLERCVGDLQAQNNSPRPQQPNVPRQRNDPEEDEDDDEDMEDEEENETAISTAISTPATLPQDRSGSGVSLPSLSQITTTTTTSPPIFSAGAGARHYSISSTSQASYSPYIHSAQTSPAFGPQLTQISSLSSAPSREQTFGLGSPAIRPLDSSSHLRQLAEGANELSDKQHQRPTKVRRSEQELDQEATTALLMLNHDRRNWRYRHEGEGGVGARGSGMSVKDLLSG